MFENEEVELEMNGF